MGGGQVQLDKQAWHAVRQVTAHIMVYLACKATVMPKQWGVCTSQAADQK
jgi:hypothetical protein